MTVIRPNSISGITSITAQANEINVFRSDGTLAGLQFNGVNFNNTSGISTLAALNVTGNVSIAGTLTYQDVTNVDSVGLITARSGINVTGGQLDVGGNIKLGNAGVITASSYRGDGSQLTGISAGFSPDAQGNLVAGTNAGDSFSGTDANHNVLLGLDAGTAITTADGCVFIGQNAGEVNTTRGGLVAIGDNSGTKVNNAYGFTAVGGGAGKNHQTGQYSVYIGFNAGTQFTGGATDNTIIGGEAHYNAQSGNYNVSVGKQAMSLAGDANKCTAIGTKALQTSSQGGSGGDNNTALGYEAGDQLVTGSNCTILGFSAQASSTSVSNEITLGDTNITKFRIPGLGYVNDAGKVGIGSAIPEKQLTVRKGSGDDGGILVLPNVSYANNQNRAYLTVGTGNWTGATTNWNTYGLQHRIKTNASGVSRVTIDGAAGEFFCVENGGNIGIGTNDPAEDLHIGSNSPYILLDDYDNSRKWRVKGTAWFAIEDATTGEDRLRITGSGEVNIGGDYTQTTRQLGVVSSAEQVASFEYNGADADGSEVRFYHNSSSPADGDVLSYLQFSGKNSADEITLYSAIIAKSVDVTNGTEDGDISFYTRGAGSFNERLRIDSDGDTHFTGQRHRFNFSNSGGVGPFLSLRNTSTTTGSSTGICFGIGGSSADLDGTDYGEGQIKVFNDSGNFGNMEFNLHVNANRSFMKIVGNGQNEGGAGAGTEGQRGGVAFGNAGIAIDRSWMGQPGIHVFNQNVENDTDQGTFRFHGWNTSYASYPGRSGSDFGVNLVGDGSGLSSDERRKTGISTITNALNTVSQMRGVSFKLINSELTPQTHMSMDSGTKLGFIAQEVIPLLPSIVIDAGGEKAVPLENGYCDRYAIDYGSVTALLLEAIKELKTKNEALESRLAALEGS